MLVDTMIVNCHSVVPPSVLNPGTHGQEDGLFAGGVRGVRRTRRAFTIPKAMAGLVGAVGPLRALLLIGEKGSSRVPGHQAQLCWAFVQRCTRCRRAVWPPPSLDEDLGCGRPWENSSPTRFSGGEEAQFLLLWVPLRWLGKAQVENVPREQEE